MAKYSIRDLETLSGIKAHTIRIWEKRYNLISPIRTDTNIRLYSEYDLKKILNVSLLNRHGLKISKIACLGDNDIKEKVSLITRDASDYSSQIESMAIAMVELDEHAFERAMSRAIIQIGFEETMMRIIYPFLVKIGIMWQTGTINPAQEHFISNLIRQKLIATIDSQSGHTHDPKTKKFVLFLPEGEQHELGLLFYTYLIKKRGHKLLYLGQAVPYTDLLKVNETYRPDFLVTSITSAKTPEQSLEYIQKLAALVPERKIVVVGGNASRLVLGGNDTMPSNTNIFKRSDEFASFVDEMTS